MKKTTIEKTKIPNKFVKLLFVVFPLLFLSSFPGYANTTDLENEIRRILQENNTTAASISFIEVDGNSQSLGIGIADRTTQRPVDSDTLFRIGSISKIFTSLSILKLVEEGILGLDDPIAPLVKDGVFQNPWESDYPVRIVHLLSHTTGWDDLHMSEYTHNDPTPVSLETAFSVYPRSRTSRWIPGSRSSYSNSGPGVAAYIVERTTGQSYEEFITSSFFNPIGMKTATFFQSPDYITNSATLYQGNVEQPYWNVIMRPSGSINASAKDMLGLLDFFINSSDHKILSEDSISSMGRLHGSFLAESGLEVGHGLSHVIKPEGGFVWLGHSGGVNGGLADFKYIPELGIGYYVAINSNSGRTLYEIAQLLRNHVTQNLVPSPVPYTRDTSVDTEALTGFFRVVNPRNSSLYFLEFLGGIGRIESRPEGIALVGILDGSVDLYIPVNQQQFVDPFTGKISLTIHEDPLIGTVLHNEWFTLQPVSFLSVYGPLVFIVLWLIGTIIIIIKVLVVLIRKVLGKPNKGSLIIHLLPVIQLVSFGVFVWGFVNVMAVDLLADNRLTSVIIATSTVSFLVLSILSVLLFLMKRTKHFHFYSGLVYSVMNLTIGIYLTGMGVTGYHFF